MLHRSQCTFRALQSLKFHAIYTVSDPWWSAALQLYSLNLQKCEAGDLSVQFAHDFVILIQKKSPSGIFGLEKSGELCYCAR